jgi:hypothetical protein
MIRLIFILSIVILVSAVDLNQKVHLHDEDQLWKISQKVFRTYAAIRCFTLLKPHADKNIRLHDLLHTLSHIVDFNMHSSLNLNSLPSVDDEIENTILSIYGIYLFTTYIPHNTLFRDLLSDVKLKYNLQECQLSNEVILNDEIIDDMIPNICYLKLVIQGDELFPYYRQILSPERKEKLDGRLYSTLSDDQIRSMSKVIKILDYSPDGRQGFHT